MNDSIDTRVDIIAPHMLVGEGYVAHTKNPRDAINYERYGLRVTGPVEIDGKKRWLLFYSKGKDGKGKEDRGFVWKTHKQTQKGEIFLAYLLASEIESIRVLDLGIRFGEPEIFFGNEMVPMFVKNPFKDKSAGPRSHKIRLRKRKPLVERFKEVGVVSGSDVALEKTEQIEKPNEKEKILFNFKPTHSIHILDTTTFSKCWSGGNKHVNPGRFNTMITSSPITGADIYVLKLGEGYFFKDVSSVQQFSDKFNVTKLP